MEDSNAVATPASNSSNITIAPPPASPSWEEDDPLAWIKAAFANQIVIAKVVGLLSAMGSAYIVYKLVLDVKDAADRRKKLHRTFDRLLLCLCVSDFVASMAFFLGSWSVPANPPIDHESMYKHEYGLGLTYDDMFPEAVGTTGTCSAQGFLWFVGLYASLLFTGCISVSFLLQVKFALREKQMRVAEKLFFAVSTLVPTGFAMYGLADRAFNPNPGAGFCTNFTAYGAYFGMVCSMATLLIVVVCLGMLFWSVRTQELRAARWSGSAASGRNQKRVFVKSMQYIGSFLVVWAPVPIAGFAGSRNTIYVAAFFYPLQGVLNAVIYSDLIGNITKGSWTRLASPVRASIHSSLSRISSRIVSWKGGTYGITDSADSNDDDGNNNPTEP